MLFDPSVLKYDGVEAMKSEQRNAVIEQNEAVVLQ